VKSEVLSNLPPEIFWPSPRKGYVKSFSKLLPERASFESFWSEALKLYTEDSKTDDRGWWPHRRCGFRISKKGQPYTRADFFFRVITQRDHISFKDSFT
jgi:hypothetical protein